MFRARHSSVRGHLAAGIAAAVCIASAALLFVNRQYVVDQLALWQYQPSSHVRSLAEKSGMNDTGTFYFYASHPSVENANTFNKLCGRMEPGTAILGCYNGQTIYIYNVTDLQLSGIQEVTAAHEMLHAVYKRLSGDEKKKLDTLLEAEYTKLKDDKLFSDRMAFYARTEPGERGNELHSVIGTEVSGVSSELEAHYKKYFSDRSKSIAAHEKYANVFKNLQNKSDELSKQITHLIETVEKESLSYNKEVNQLNEDIQAFNAKADSGGFSSQAAFNAERNALMKRAEQLDAKRNAINANVATYEALKKELESIAAQSDALNKSIDSSLAPAPSL